MGKRKTSNRQDDRRVSASIAIEEDDASSDEDLTSLDVEFEWFDPQPQHDFHGIKLLLQQLFDIDAQLFDLSALTDLILSQPLLGSTVKVEGNESDPFAFLTVLNLHEHRGKNVIKDLVNYIQQKALKNSVPSNLANLLAPESQNQVGLILTERFVNMPPQVASPMYTMLQEEISWAIQEKEPYSFSHYLILSKAYEEVAPSVDHEQYGPQKKRRKGTTSNETMYFHPEDEVLHKNALWYCDFDYNRENDNHSTDARRAFGDSGIKPKGHLILLDGLKFETAVSAIAEYMKA